MHHLLSVLAHAVVAASEPCSCMPCGSSTPGPWSSGSCTPANAGCSATVPNSGCYTDCAAACDCGSNSCNTGPPSPSPAPVGTCDGSSSGLPAAECNAWLTIYDTMDGKNWRGCSYGRTDPCGYNTCGLITCNNNHVTGMSLGNNYLRGSLPTSISDFTKLDYLYASAWPSACVASTCN